MNSTYSSSCVRGEVRVKFAGYEKRSENIKERNMLISSADIYDPQLWWNITAGTVCKVVV